MTDLPVPTLTRRAVVRQFAGGALALAGAGLLLPRAASAAIGWCQSDPGLVIGGKLTNVTVSRDASAPNTTTGPIQLVVSVPVGVSTALSSIDNGFGFGYAITFQQDPSLNTPGGGQISIRLAVYVPGSDPKLAIQVVSTPLDPRFGPQAKKGAVNAWITMNTQV